MPLTICGRDFNVEGRLIRTARLEGDTYKFLTDPQAFVEGFRQATDRVDLCPFTQRLPECSPQYAYPWEWDNLAVLPVSSFDNWWSEIGFKARNKAKQAEKKGVLIREVAFDETLIEGIWDIYNETP